MVFDADRLFRTPSRRGSGGAASWPGPRPRPRLRGSCRGRSEAPRCAMILDAPISSRTCTMRGIGFGTSMPTAAFPGSAPRSQRGARIASARSSARAAIGPPSLPARVPLRTGSPPGPTVRPAIEPSTRKVCSVSINFRPHLLDLRETGVTIFRGPGCSRSMGINTPAGTEMRDASSGRRGLARALAALQGANVRRARPLAHPECVAASRGSAPPVRPFRLPSPDSRLPGSLTRRGDAPDGENPQRREGKQARPGSRPPCDRSMHAMASHGRHETHQLLRRAPGGVCRRKLASVTVPDPYGISRISPLPAPPPAAPTSSRGARTPPVPNRCPGGAGAPTPRPNTCHRASRSGRPSCRDGQPQ